MRSIVSLFSAAGAIALGLYGCTSVQVPFPLAGPCAAWNRDGPNEAYYQLSLSMVADRVFMPGAHMAPSSQTEVIARRDFLSDLMSTWPPTIRDACLRAHVERWIAFYDRSASDHLSFARRAAEGRALAARLKAE